MALTMMRAFASAAVALFVITEPVRGQWWGPILDKIGEMSGPEIYYLGLTMRFGFQPGQHAEDLLAVARESEIAALRSRPIRLNIFRMEGQRQDFDASMDAVDSCVARLSEAAAMVSPTGYDEAVVDRLRASPLNDTRSIDQARDRLRTVSDADSLTRWADTFETAVCNRAAESTVILDSLGAPARTRGWALRLGLYSGADKRNGDNDADIYGFMIKHSIEHTWTFGTNPTLGLGLEGGMQHHYLHGDIDGFWHRTYYAQANFYPFATNERWFLRNIRVGAGGAIIPGFEEDAFTSRGIESTQTHLTYILTIGWDFGMSGAPFFSGR